LGGRHECPHWFRPAGVVVTMNAEVRAQYEHFRHLHPDMPAYLCHLLAIRRAEVAREVTSLSHNRFTVCLDGIEVVVSVLEDAYGPDECERPGDLSFVMFASIKGAMLDCLGGIEVGPWWTAADTDEQGWYMREMAHDVASGAVAVYESRESV
jgi:hypothetical protein